MDNTKSKLRLIREERKMTLKQVADLVGISKVYLSLIERGMRGPSYSLAANIASVFSLSTDELFSSEKLTKSEHLSRTQEVS